MFMQNYTFICKKLPFHSFYFYAVRYVHSSEALYISR